MTDHDNDDRAIIERIKLGEKNEFAQLVRRYEARLRGLCCNMLCDSAAAEDASQEAFIRAYRSIQTFRGDCPFVHWLCRIAINVCKDIRHRRFAQPTVSWDELRDKNAGALEGLSALPTDVSMPHEHAQALRRVLQALSVKEREILLLCEFEGLSYQEIASTLSCSIDSVKGRLRRVREKIDRKLRHFLEPPAVISIRKQE
ncbi:MAG TPA: sigma-70 family RNA polymerase sigma factor [Oligoflexia bacterium]|nr:sigma-70 family RNA polymerase sigma factor [Oligoflexia bacterium]